MVAPGGVGVVRGEPTLLRKLQAAKKEAVKSPAKTQKATRLQEIMEEGGAAYEMQGEEARTKELQSQKARIVAQMVPAQVPRSTTESPFEDAENVPALVLETAQGERRVRVRTKETQAVLGSSGRRRYHTNTGRSQGERVRCCGGDPLCRIRCFLTGPAFP
ncbi:hypothetical protein EDB85DRAFT_276033 [Lactarius pseudohatsudake]|nr:hypothetical protein EDB85DRAFT_276033 [Lactarius pseudohatsudake]